MTGTEGETAVLALAACAVTPWALFLARIWKVSTATRKTTPPETAAVPAADTAPAGAAVPSITEKRGAA